MSVQISRHRFSVDDYYRMVDAGILCERDRIELIDGEVVTISSPGPRHSACVTRTTRAFFARVGETALVRVQDPVRLNRHNQPQPDLSIVRPRTDFYEAGHPGPTDILLIIEVADSSLDYDRVVKARIYGESGVPEYWVVDVIGESLWRHTELRDGSYRSIRECRRGEGIAPELLPDVLIAVEDLIGD
jgi:Uma2 family endonuclease